MSQALDYAVSVTGLLLSLLAGVLWLSAAPSSRAPRRWLTAVLVIYLAFSVHAIGTMASWPLRRVSRIRTASPSWGTRARSRRRPRAA